jgi:hypothetical protein
MRWPGKAIARDNARVIVDDGHYKNGNPKTKLMFKCAGCLDLYEKEDTQADHINPVVDIKGFTNWDQYINALFCQPSGYQILCKTCHLSKTLSENSQRK